MSFVEFIKSKLRLNRNNISTQIPSEKLHSITTHEYEQANVDRTNWTGENFEFLIVGEIDVFSDFDNIMTPNSFKWEKTNKEKWEYYQVGSDEYRYSIEETGIQMTFNKEIKFEKAKKIGDEVIININALGQKAELVILDKNIVYGFD